MELRQVEYVVAVVDATTFTNAAARLHVSQPSLSQGIARLEAELGTALFHRLGRRVVLTAAGEAFIGPARQVLRDVTVLGDSVRAVAGLEAGALDLVALPTLAADPLAPLIGAFRQAHPNVTVRMAEPESADAVANRVRDGRAELGFAELPVPGHDLTIEAILDQELVLVRPPGSPSHPVRIENLVDVPLVTSPPGTSTRRLLNHAFAAADLEPLIAVETEQREAIVPVVLAGAGVALLPTGVADHASQRGATVAHLDPPLHRTIGLIARPGPLSPAADEFRKFATNH